VLPVVAVVLGALILNEPLTWHLLAGGLTVLVGVAVSEGGSARPCERSRSGTKRSWREGICSHPLGESRR
jgi:hypothetical protein